MNRPARPGRLQRLALLALLPVALLAGCTSGSPPPSSVGAAVRPAVPAACVAENQACDTANRCCPEMVCTSTGRFGNLCRRVFPS